MLKNSDERESMVKNACGVGGEMRQEFANAEVRTSAELSGAHGRSGFHPDAEVW